MTRLGTHHVLHLQPAESVGALIAQRIVRFCSLFFHFSASLGVLLLADWTVSFVPSF